MRGKWSIRLTPSYLATCRRRFHPFNLSRQARPLRGRRAEILTLEHRMAREVREGTISLSPTTIGTAWRRMGTGMGRRPISQPPGGVRCATSTSPALRPSEVIASIPPTISSASISSRLVTRQASLAPRGSASMSTRTRRLPSNLSAPDCLPWPRWLASIASSLDTLRMCKWHWLGSKARLRTSQAAASRSSSAMRSLASLER
mmetsp:Transcript_35067/g.54792  ORF Transcript_35067/g.54792 Transcript_35067/m.54792 type:complete len:203 (-) Transcript_35067:652-1260(-)